MKVTSLILYFLSCHSRAISAEHGAEEHKGKEIFDQSVVVDFVDGTSWSFQAAWLIDAMASRMGEDDFRMSSDGFGYFLNEGTYLNMVETNGETPSMISMEWRKDILGDKGDEVNKLEINAHNSTLTIVEKVPSIWLRALAPIVALPQNELSKTSVTEENHKIAELCGHGRGFAGVFEAELEEAHDGHAMSNIPENLLVYNYDQMKKSRWKHLEFLLTIAKNGFAWVDGVEQPEENVFRNAEAHRDLPIQEAVRDLMGNFPSHPSRYGNHFVFDNQNSKENKDKASQDYKLDIPLKLHTDHTIYQGTPGFLAWFHQVLGDTEPVLVDGLAITNAFAREHPDFFRVLVQAKVMHGYKHLLYDKNGMKRKVDDENSEPRIFDLMYEDASTINLYEDSDVEEFILWARNETKSLSERKPMLAKLRLSETKRAMLPGFQNNYELRDFMKAYDTFRSFAEESRFDMKAKWPEGRTLVFSNYRMLHGRARFLSSERVTIGGYTSRLQWNSKLRQLVRECAEELAPELKTTGNWASSLPDVALHNIGRIAREEEARISRAASEIKAKGWTVVNVGGVALPIKAKIVDSSFESEPSSPNERDDALVATFPHLAMRIWRYAGWADVKIGEYSNGNTQRQTFASKYGNVSTSIYDVKAGSPSNEMIMPHSELAYTASPPKFAAFYCQHAATNGGEMTVTDMLAVASDMKSHDAYKDIFSKMRTHGFRYTRYMGCRERSPEWPYATGFWQDIHPNATSLDDTVARIRHSGAFGKNVSLSLADTGIAKLQWQVAALGALDDGREVLLANHMDFILDVASESCQHCKDKWGVTREVSWGDGSTLLPEEVDVFRTVYQMHTEDVLLSPGEILILDNFWVAHGRRPYFGGDRMHYAIFSESYHRGSELKEDLMSDVKASVTTF